MDTILVGTDDGVHVIGEGSRFGLSGRAIAALALDGRAVWAIADGSAVLRGGEEVAASDGLGLNCLAVAAGQVFVGASEAHLVRLDGDELRPVEAFDNAEGREDWYTPWGGPADVRSIAPAADGTLYVNVHVGGILRSDDQRRTWSSTIDIDSDVHQVVADPDDPAHVLAATAYGLADSRDGGRTWTMTTAGMHATYCRAVALADTVLMSCSTGPGGRHAAVYRLAGTAFEKCTGGLPEWFDGNIDTARLAAAGSTAAFGTAGGEVYVSQDAGRTWEQAAQGLPSVRSLLLAPA